MANHVDDKSEGFPTEGKPQPTLTLNKASVNLIIDDFKKIEEEISNLEAKIISTSYNNDT